LTKNIQSIIIFDSSITNNSKANKKRHPEKPSEKGKAMIKRRIGLEIHKTDRLIKRFIDSGHVAFDGKNYRFTDEGFFVSSYILSEILDFS